MKLYNVYYEGTITLRASDEESAEQMVSDLLSKHIKGTRITGVRLNDDKEKE